MKHLNYFNVLFTHLLMKTTIFSYLLRLALLVCCLSILSVNLPIGIDATSTFYQNNEMYFTGTLIYINSTQGTPVDRLDDGRIHTIYLNAEAERNLAIDPYVTNMSTDTLKGWIDDGYEVQIPFSQSLAVTQPHSTTNGQTRNATAYYEVIVEDIQTNLLYRPDRNDNYITILCGGGILLLLYTVFKVVRHD